MTKIDLNRRKYIEHLSKLGINLVQPFFFIIITSCIRGEVSVCNHFSELNLDLLQISFIHKLLEVMVEGDSNHLCGLHVKI